MQVPTVTPEDLQAFQATHFPGHPQPLIPLATETVTEDNTEEDDDLGYYTDGVKRTLTDEQIRIFRHSEIHALLRARQLQQDDAEYEARRRVSEEDGLGAEMSPSHEKLTSEDRGKMEPTVSSPRSSSARGKANQLERETPSAVSESLDYGEGHHGSAGKKPQVETRVPYPGRKIVSYAD